MLYVLLTLFAAAIVAVDQWTKALAAAQLAGRTVVLIPGWLQLHYITNDGMALSLLSGKRWFFVVINRIDIAITLIIALCIVLSLKLAGIILVISYLTIPQAIAGIFYKNFKQQLLASALVSTAGSITGLFLSAFLNIPTGATIVICFLLFFLISWLINKIR